MIRIRIQSRHTLYFLWISYNADEGAQNVSGWYCLCKAGARTVGCCVDIASVLWYLRYERHSSDALAADSVQIKHFLNAADKDCVSEDDDDESSVTGELAPIIFIS